MPDECELCGREVKLEKWVNDDTGEEIWVCDDCGCYMLCEPLW